MRNVLIYTVRPTSSWLYFVSCYHGAISSSLAHTIILWLIGVGGKSDHPKSCSKHINKTNYLSGNCTVANLATNWTTLLNLFTWQAKVQLRTWTAVRINAALPVNIWPSIYSRDHCHCEMWTKLEGVDQPGPLCKCHEAVTCCIVLHTDMLQPQERQHKTPGPIQVPTYIYPILYNAHQTTLW